MEIFGLLLKIQINKVLNLTFRINSFFDEYKELKIGIFMCGTMIVKPFLNLIMACIDFGWYNCQFIVWNFKIFFASNFKYFINIVAESVEIFSHFPIRMVYDLPYIDLF